MLKCIKLEKHFLKAYKLKKMKTSVNFGDKLSRPLTINLKGSIS